MRISCLTSVYRTTLVIRYKYSILIGGKDRSGSISSKSGELSLRADKEISVVIRRNMESIAERNLLKSLLKPKICCVVGTFLLLKGHHNGP